MKKIIAGFLGLMMVVVMSSTAAYALFSSTTTVNGVTFATGNATLEFYATAATPSNTWTKNVSFPTTFSNMYPGYNGYNEFYLRNSSTSVIQLVLKARLVSATNDWGTLSPVVEAWIGDDTGVTGSGYFTLANWNASERDINITLNKGEQKLMRLYVNVPTTAGNEIADKTVSTNWEIIGYQAP